MTEQQRYEVYLVNRHARSLPLSSFLYHYPLQFVKHKFVCSPTLCLVNESGKSSVEVGWQKNDRLCPKKISDCSSSRARRGNDGGAKVESNAMTERQINSYLIEN
jgi:hypothetical protein